MIVQFRLGGVGGQFEIMVFVAEVVIKNVLMEIENVGIVWWLKWYWKCWWLLWRYS